MTIHRITSRITSSPYLRAHDTVIVTKTGVMEREGLSAGSSMANVRVNDLTFDISGKVNNPQGSGIEITGHRAEITIAKGAQVSALHDLASGIVTGQDGISVYGNDLTLKNAGQLIGTYGLDVEGDGAVIRNSGQITGKGSYEAGLRVDGEGMLLVNTGQIAGVGNGLTLSLSGTGNRVVNSGTITGKVGVEHYSYEVGFTLVNTGTIRGTHAAVFVGEGTNRLENSGVLAGMVKMGQEQDTVLNSGAIKGKLDLGAGNDVYTASKAGSVTKTIYGNLGDDRLQGASAIDRLTGGAGDDTITGGSGADFLAGNTGRDRLTGGAGSDRLLGGGDGDVFIFAKGASASDIDRIEDFTVGLDRIDLSQFDFSDSQAVVRRSTADGLMIDLRQKGGGQVLLEGIMAADFHTDDLIL